MAKQRMINTKFWSDNWVRLINPLDRYLFMYLLTNEHTNISGIYELPLSTMSFECGIDERDLEKSMLPRLEPKVFYIEGWVCLANFQKHQSSSSIKVQRGIEIEMEKIPLKIKELFKNKYYSDMVSNPIIYPNLNSNLNSNSNSNRTKNTDSLKKPFGEFKTVKLTKEEYKKLIEKFGEEQTESLIAELDTYVASKGKRYASHYATILSWARRKGSDYEQTGLLDLTKK